MKLARAKGCKKCANSGYKGRVGLFEAIVMDDELKELVLESPSTAQLKKKAVERGMCTLRQDGLLLVLRGITTMEEIERVTAD